MSVLDIPLRKVLQLFYASPALLRRILKEDITLEQKKISGGNRSRGGNFHNAFWKDVKKHISKQGDLKTLTNDRIKANKRLGRLYPLLADGVLDLLNSKLRWSNEEVEIVSRSIHGTLKIHEVDGTIRVHDALHARVRGEYTRIVYPYFSEEPKLSDEAARLGLWVMQRALIDFNPDDMRIIDPLSKTFFSPRTTPLQGDEEITFLEKYASLITEWTRLRNE